MSTCKHGKMKKRCNQCNRRRVGQITTYLEPKKIFQLITGKGWPYATDKEKYHCRDRAFMGMALCSVGRITPICGGPKLLVENTCKLCDGIVQKLRVNDNLVWICTNCGKDFGQIKPKDSEDLKVKLRIVGKYDGLTRGNLEITRDFIQVVDMKVAKRTTKLIEKRGLQVTIREPFKIPLEKGLYESDFGDQLVPFGWLVVEYLKNYVDPAKPKPTRRLFPFKRCRGWQIIKTVTKMFPNWFRAQAEHFYGHYLIQDSVRLSKFIKVERPEQVAHYIGFSYDSLLKDKQRYMDFEWIDKAVNQIQRRIK